MHANYFTVFSDLMHANDFTVLAHLPGPNLDRAQNSDVWMQVERQLPQQVVLDEFGYVLGACARKITVFMLTELLCFMLMKLRCFLTEHVRIEEEEYLALVARTRRVDGQLDAVAVVAQE